MERYTLIYDGECAFCRRSVSMLQKWDVDHVVGVVPFQDPGVPRRFPWIPASAFREAMQLVGPSNTTWAGAAAFEELVRVLPKGKAFAWLFHVPLVRRVADRVYRWVARNRGRLGCAAHCAVKPG